MVMRDVAAAGMMMIGVREGRLPPPPPGGGLAAATGSNSLRPGVPDDGGPFSIKIVSYSERVLIFSGGPFRCTFLEQDFRKLLALFILT